LDKKLCPRYTARVIRNVSIGESPAWLKTRVEAMGLRTVNNIVDITNFCLFETGEPMHAFDLDKIKGGKIIIRKAKKGERIVTIDGVERLLDDKDLVIADEARPIAIAGVMGGLNTEVMAYTKNILLEAAYFDPVSIRRTSRRLGISTESSYRFERRVDPENIIPSSERASALILKETGGSIGRLYDIGRSAPKEKMVDLRPSHLNKISGIDMPAAKVKSILTALGLKIRSSSGDKIRLAMPHFRHDLDKEIDLIEEVARINGYDKIPRTIPPIITQPALEAAERIADNRIRSALTALGLDEIITYSLLSRNMLNRFSASHSDDIVKIANPLSNEQEIMRPTLIAGMLSAIRWNLNRKAEDLRLFELGNVYLKSSHSGYSEKKALAIGMTGKARSNWLDGTRPTGFFDLKGVVEALFSGLGIRPFSFKAVSADGFAPAACAGIEIGGVSAGILGEINRKALGDFDLKNKVYMLEMDAGEIIKNIVLKTAFVKLPKYPSVHRDISIIVGKDVSNRDVVASIREIGGAVLKEAELVDRYAGKQIPDGKVGLTYRLEYQDPGKTLEDKAVSDVHSNIINTLETRFGARLR